MSGIPTMSGSDANGHPAAAIRLPRIRARRWLYGALVAATTLAGAAMMLDIMRDGGVTLLELVILALFTATFGWIAMPFWNAVIGFALALLGRDPLSLERLSEPGEGPPDAAAGSSRTALVMPVHNEDPARVTAGLAAMLRSLDRAGHLDRFDLFLLSDTTDAAIAEEEAAAWTALRRRFGDGAAMHYRRRTANVGRKAGNIADFCRRWGARYEFMVVLDADSIMTDAALTQLVRAMEANPQAGLIQTVPLPARRTTLFGRCIQFASCLYGPLLAAGQAWWQSDTANYWGHNAIIRVAPFSAHCGLPVLPGRPPLGGAILSHDFVEAALMRRAGWDVYLLPLMGGSYEEAPGNVVDYARRDRRWCQGSLQHLRLLGVPGFHPLNRLYFVLGAGGYLSSVAWLLLLLAGTLYVLLSGPGAPLLWAPRMWPGPAVPLLAVTAGLLLAPRILALLQVLAARRRAFGGAPRLLAGTLLETLFSVVVAPVMMLYHTRFVASVLAGRDIRWEAQVREGNTLGWREAWAGGAWWITLAGAVWGAVTLYASPVFLLWLSPILTGLLLAAPLIRWTSSRAPGAWTRRRGLLLVPSETAPPPELAAGELLEAARPPASVEADSRQPVPSL
ncbi:MAG: glucans biosynthesis glucosyltransferase MdoH [Acidobacteria bacterium]|nr:glucans biosynthesis glucosyltransferase MdoH [Acidobacteriota bacterium]